MSRDTADDGTNVRVSFHQKAGESEKAVRVFVSETDFEGIWIPKSLIAHFDEDTGEVWVPEWFARKEGLEYE